MPGILVKEHMTASPVTVGRMQPLAVAHRLMREHGFHHLPVLDSGQLVGIVSQHDLHFIETLADVDPEVVTVEEAMTAVPYTVGPRAHITRVMREMVARRCGSAVVVDHGRIVGMFTTVDALRAAADLLEPRKARGVARPRSSARRAARPHETGHAEPGAARTGGTSSDPNRSAVHPPG